MKSVKFFNQYLTNLGRLTLTNILFAPFGLLAAAYVILTYKLLDGLNITAAAAAVVILNVGMAGVTQVCRYIYIEKEFSVPSAFFKGLKENALRFLFHGAVFYIAFAVSYLSLYLYYSGTHSHAFFWLPLIITAVIALGLLFSSYYLNIMTATMDISMRDTYRNCVLFSFGELKNNILATAGLLILGIIIFAVVYIINNEIAAAVIITIFQAFVIPSTAQYIITFYVYDDMVSILDASKREKRSESENLEAEKRPSTVVINEEDSEALEQLAEESRDEFIFYNGKMIRRSELEKLRESDQ